MRKLDPRLILIVSAASVLFMGIFISVAINEALDAPATCSGCHEMDMYVTTYLVPVNGSVIAEHRSDCFGCHSNTSRQRAKNAVLKEIGISTLNKITGNNFNTERSDFAVNCLKCHVLKGYSHLNITSNAGCGDCHWAHTPTSSAFNPYLIPSGPHRNQTCSNCHGKDFKIPRCINCHTGHGGQKLENSLCLACHTDPHLPIKPGILPGNTVNFTKDMPFSLCAPCHEKQYYDLNISRSRHLDMQTCTLCHDSHGKRPRCSQCHPDLIVHGHTTLQCNDCHGRISGLQCKLCHGVTHEWSAITALLPDEVSPVNESK